MGLRSKILFLLFALLVVPLILLASAGYWLLKTKSYENALFQQRLLAAQVVNDARHETVRSYGFIAMMANSASLVSSIQQYRQAPSVQTAADIGSSLMDGLSLNEALVEVAVYEVSGAVIEASRMRSDWHQQYPNLPTEIDPKTWRGEEPPLEFIQVTDSESIYRTGRSVRNADGTVVGYMLVHAAALGLDRSMEGLTYVSSLLFFCDNAGHMLARSGGIDLPEIPVNILSQFDANSDAASFIAMEIETRHYQLIMQRVNDKVWFGSLLDVEDALARFRSIIATMLAVMAVLVALVSCFLYFQLARLVIRPVDRLNQATKQISAGDYLPRIDVHGHDEIAQLAASFRIMGERLKESNERVTQLAFYDPLTKLPNRETLRRALARMIDVAERSNSLLGVLFIDLDDFKKVNDRLGHVAGDQLLVVIGERLSDSLRSGDLLVGNPEVEQEASESMISRRGGDEFNAILNNLKSARDIALIAERLITDINEPVMLDDSPVSVGASIGIAIYPFDGADADTLLRNADLAMYEAKGLGKNKYYLFTEAINGQVHDRLELEQRIASGLQHSEFELWFQPRISLQSRTVAGFEALIRWRDPGSGLVSPVEFIPLAEESQLIHDIGRWVIAEAFHHVKEWDELLPPDIRIAINVSARQLVQDSFAENFISLARQFDIPLSRLEIELTETSILTDEALVKRHLQKLRAVDVRISLDDFGTGYSSLTFLRNLPIDTVKIDGSFIHLLENNSHSKEIVAAVLDLCNRLQLVTVAECVETEQQLDYLVAHGCREGQGYYFAKPMPAEELLEFLRSPEYLSM